jgi:hypothetical protein
MYMSIFDNVRNSAKKLRLVVMITELECLLNTCKGGYIGVDKRREILHVENEDKQTIMPKINISLSKDILDEMDSVGREENLTRSELLRRAFITYREVLALRREEDKKRLAISEAIKIQDEIRSILGEADLTKDLSAWREKRR